MPKHKLIACEVFYREFNAVMEQSPNEIDVEFLRQGLHDAASTAMAGHIQEHIDSVPSGEYDAILLGYGLCNNGTVGLQSTHTPLVITRAHDCITMFMGCKNKYKESFEENPGTYYLTSGWIERANKSIDTLPTRKAGLNVKDEEYQKFVEKYGEDNAQYLWETMSAWKTKYGRMNFIDMGVGDVDSYRNHTKQQAEQRELSFVETKGDLRLFAGLVNGPEWDADEYLVLQPGQKISASFQDSVMGAE